MVDPKMAQIPFGPGLDKESGAMIVRPGSMLDLRNVYHHEGSLVARAGMEKKIQFTDYITGEPATHILAGIAIRSLLNGIVVSFYEPTGHVTIHSVDGLAEYGTPLGNWPYGVAPTNLVWPSSEIPKVILAEIYGQVYFAHDEKHTTKRAPTWVYDPFFAGSDTGGLGPLKAVLNKDHRLTAEEIHDLPTEIPDPPYPDQDERYTAEYVRFRGVARHMDYLFGWGWGNTEAIRPEMVRVSYPGEPRRWHPEHYFIAGDRRDPVVSGNPARQTFLVFKETETYQIFGYSRATFGIRPYDNLFGCLAGRLSHTVSGQTFFWSAEGPRVAGDRGPSEKISLPLDLGGYEPSTLVERTDFRDGWCDYIDEVELLYYGFGRRLYVLSLRNPADPRWTYWELARKAYCGFRLYGDESSPVPVGYPAISATSWTDAGGCSFPKFNIEVTHTDAQDTDYIELWLKRAGLDFGADILPSSAGLTVDLDADGIPDEWTLDTSEKGSAASSASIASAGFWMSLYGGTAADDKLSLYHDYSTDITDGFEYRYECDMYVPKAFVAPSGALQVTGLFIRMEFLGTADAVLGTEEQYLNQGEWNRTYVQGTAPTGTLKIRIRIGVTAAVGGEVYAYFRNAELYEQTDGEWFRAELGGPDRVPVQVGATQDLPPYEQTDPGVSYTLKTRYVNLAGLGGPGYADGDQDNWPGGGNMSNYIPAAGLIAVFQGSDVFGPYQEIVPQCGLGAVGLVGALLGNAPVIYTKRDMQMQVEWSGGGPYTYPPMNRGAYRQRLYWHDLSTGEDYTVRVRYIKPPGTTFSGWSTPTTVRFSGIGSGDVPTLALTSPASKQLSMDWAWGTDAAPEGKLRAIEFWFDYDMVSALGDYRRFYDACGEIGSPFACYGFPPADPYVYDMEGSPGGLTVSVKIREVYVDPDWGWNIIDSNYSYGPWSDVESIAVTT